MREQRSVTLLGLAIAAGGAVVPVLLVVLLITALLAGAMGTYLNLTLQDHKMVKRSLSWNALIPPGSLSATCPAA